MTLNLIKAMKWFKEKELCCKCCGQLPPLAKEKNGKNRRTVLWH